MKMIQLILGASIVWFAASVSADWTGSKKVIMIYPQSQSATILFKQVSTSSSDCPGSAGAYYALEESHANYKNIYSLLLAAYSMQEPVNLLLSGCTNEGYTKINLVIMQK